MQTLSKAEVEQIALKVAAILQDRVDGDPSDYHSWLRAGEGICTVTCIWDGKPEAGYVFTDHFPDTEGEYTLIYAQGSSRRPAHLARVLIHELSHAVLRHFAPDVFTETPWRPVDNAYQCGERICRAVERYFLGAFGRCDLPAHGFYWH